MTLTPVEVSDDLFAALQRHFDEGQLVELTAAIAWENYRARFDHALGVEAQGFSGGGVLRAARASHEVPERTEAMTSDSGIQPPAYGRG